MSGLPLASNLYFDNHFKRPGVKLLPNEFYMTGEDMVLVTVLGSCVAACIHDRTAGIGGMNHFMLPDDGSDASQSSSDSMRYGAYAMEVLINEMIKRVGLDYFTVDCAENRCGELLIFEADNTAVVHNMDSPDVFPYKQPQMRKIFAAFTAMLSRHAKAGEVSAA